MKPALSFLSAFIFVMSMALSLPILANEAPAAPAAGSSEQEKPWLAVQTEVSGLKTKRQQLISNFAKAAEEKQHMKPGSAAFREKNAELVKIHKDLKIVTEDYNRQLIVLKYRFPERLAKQAERKYEPFELPEQNELEAQFDLDARLTRSMNRARGQYGGPHDSTLEGRAPSSVPGESFKTEEPLTIREEDAPLFKK